MWPKQCEFLCDNLHAIDHQAKRLRRLACSGCEPFEAEYHAASMLSSLIRVHFSADYSDGLQVEVFASKLFLSGELGEQGKQIFHVGKQPRTGQALNVPVKARHNLV